MSKESEYWVEKIREENQRQAGKTRPKLFVVLGGVDCEAFDTFMGAYSTRELAEKRISEITGWDEKHILEIEIDKDHNAI